MLGSEIHHGAALLIWPPDSATQPLFVHRPVRSTVWPPLVSEIENGFGHLKVWRRFLSLTDLPPLSESHPPLSKIVRCPSFEAHRRLPSTVRRPPGSVSHSLLSKVLRQLSVEVHPRLRWGV
jgi:hypothetical protein